MAFLSLQDAFSPQSAAQPTPPAAWSPAWADQPSPSQPTPAPSPSTFVPLDRAFNFSEPMGPMSTPQGGRKPGCRRVSPRRRPPLGRPRQWRRRGPRWPKVPLGTQDTQDNPFALAGQANSLLQRGGQVANAFDPGATTNIGGSGLNL